jgi:hypothetical protein
MTLQIQAESAVLAALGHYEPGDTVADLLPEDHFQWVTSGSSTVLLYGQDTWAGDRTHTMWDVAATVQHGQLVLADWVTA